MVSVFIFGLLLLEIPTFAISLSNAKAKTQDSAGRDHLYLSSMPS